MLKKILSVFTGICLISSLFALSVTTSAASSLKWEVIQDYENEASIDAQASAGGDILTVITGNRDPIYGNGSVQIQVKNPSWSNDSLVAAAPAPTIANPKGIFFRIETNAAKGSTLRLVLGADDWSYDSPDDGSGSASPDTVAAKKVAAFVTDDGTVSYGRTPSDYFSGYVFIPMDPDANSDLDFTKIARVALLFSPWYGLSWDGTTSTFDNVGYYSVSATTADSEYMDIVDSLNAQYTSNPAIINSLTTGTYNNDVLSDSTTQLQLVGLHTSGKTFLWSIDNTNIATIDSKGMITPKKLGKAKVTVSVPNVEGSAVSLNINVVKGSIFLTLEDSTRISDALVETQCIFGIKSKLNAGVFYNGFDNSIAWSVVSGSASIEDLDVGLENVEANNSHSCLVTFKNSGKIVIRAALKDDSTVYRDFTYDVIANPSFLNAKILEAQSMGGTFTETGYANLLEVISDAQELIDSENASQAQYDAAINAIQVAMNNLNSDSSENPNTDDKTNIIFVVTLLCFAGAFILGFRKRLFSK